MTSTLFKKYLPVILVFPIVSLSLLAQESVFYEKNKPIRLPAPTGTTDNILGEGFDKNLNKVGRAFNLKPVEVSSSEYSALDYNMSDEFTLNANAHYLFAKAGVNVNKGKRYSVLRVYQIVKTKKIDPPLNSTVKVPATLFASAIHYGHMFEIILEGDYEKLNSKLGANLIKFGGDISSEISKHRLTQKTFARGLSTLVPNAVVVALNRNDFETNFKLGKPEPIFIEYSVLEEFTTPAISFKNTLLEPGQWKIQSIKAKVSSKKPNNNNWDMLGGKPDIRFKVDVGTNQNSIVALRSSETLKDRFEAQWNNCAISFTLKENEFIMVSLNDDDPEGDDYIGYAAINTNEVIGAEIGEEIVLNVKDNNGGVENISIIIGK